jgi:streptogramin lyase
MMESLLLSTATLRFFRSAAPALFLAGSLALGGCDTRVRDNPFDPLNPDTGGRPGFLTAVAKDRRVDLQWTDGGMRNVAGYVVYRGTSRDSITPIATLMPERRILRDAGLKNDVTYYYAIGFAFIGQGELLTAAEPVTPGVNRPWVIDNSNSPLLLLAADGRNAVSRHAHGRTLVDLSVEQATGFAWSVDPDAGVLLAHDSADFSGRLAAQWVGFSSPTRVSADKIEGGVWMVSYDEGFLYRVDHYGRRAVVDSFLVGPLDVEASPDGGCWVAESTGLVDRVDADGAAFTVEQLSYPAEISATDHGDVWVADPVADEVVRLSEEGIQARAGGFLGPFGVAAGPDGGCWVADGDRVVKVDRSGEIAITVTGFQGAGSLDVSPRTGECWVADTEGDRVVRIGPDGTWLTITTGVSSPFRIQGQWWDLHSTAQQAACNRRP